LYFTDPASPSAETLRGGPDADLAAAITQARLGVDIAMDTLDLWSLRDALIDAKRRGVTVRVVVESDNLDEAEVQELMRAGIPVLGDRREGLMHNKFAVIDRMEVWTGSMNFTLSGAYRADNNLIRLRSAQLAEDYLVEFEEMFVEDRFGPGSPANTPYPRLEVGGTPVEVYFSPDDGVSGRLLDAIQVAGKHPFMAAPSRQTRLPRRSCARRSQVVVAGVFDKFQAGQNQGSEFRRLRRRAGVRLDGNPHSMHHKVMVIDGQVVVTGSYNFSNNAGRATTRTCYDRSPEIAAVRRRSSGEYLRWLSHKGNQGRNSGSIRQLFSQKDIINQEVKDPGYQGYSCQVK
jgi:phosphatidylserine/phosphatidylglycerophosphate/cardiolipin synthase-like enzyme